MEASTGGGTPGHNAWSVTAQCGASPREQGRNGKPFVGSEDLAWEMRALQLTEDRVGTLKNKQ